MRCDQEVYYGAGVVPTTETAVGCPREDRSDLKAIGVQLVGMREPNPTRVLPGDVLACILKPHLTPVAFSIQGGAS